MNKHKSSKIKENSNTVRHLIIGQIITTQNLVATKVVRLAGQLLELFEAYHWKQGRHSSDAECYNTQPFIRAFQRYLTKTVVDSTYGCIWAVCNVKYNIVLCWIVLLRDFTGLGVGTIQLIYAPNSVKVISFWSDVQYREIRFRFSNWFAGNWRKKRQRLTGINTILNLLVPECY